MNITEIMKATFFNGMNEKDVLPFLLASQNSRRKYQSNSFIALQGDICRSLYLLTEGSVRAQMVNADGKELTIEVLKAPLVLAPAFLFSNDNHFPVNIEVVKDAEVILINKDLLLDFLHKYPVAMLNFLQLVSNLNALLTKRLNLFALQSLKTRLLDYIRIHNQIGSQQEVAKRLGVARPSLARAISELLSDKVIIINGKEIRINDKSSNYE